MSEMGFSSEPLPPLPGFGSRGEILQEIDGEVESARKQHPTWPVDWVHQAAIVAEEAGELVRAALQTSYEPLKPGAGVEAIRQEAIQCAAMCVRLLANLGDGERAKT